MNEDQLYDAAEREMDLYRAEITRITAARDEAHEQLRLARADRDQLKKRMLDLASAWKDEAADDLARIRPAPGGSTRAGVLNQCAGQICKGLDA